MRIFPPPVATRNETRCAMRRGLSLVFSTSLFLAVPIASLAQTFGQITGMVTDATGGVLVTLTVAPTSTPPVASVTMPVIWPNVWARDAMGTARKRLVEKTSERPRRIAHLVSFLVATGGGKIRMRQYHADQERS